jgi:tetratricopeptide (TPR) repeat protein/CRP-like cAMP-binding protein
VREYLRQSHSIGRENWSQYGNAAMSIEICFLEFASRQSGMLGLFNMIEIRNLATLGSHRKLKQNEVLCAQGDAADSMFIVLSGLAGVIVNGMNVAYITRGQEVGELGLISNFAKLRTATIVAHYDFEVAVIKYEDFFEFFEMLQPKRAKRVAQFVAECALPKYFALSEWKRAVVAQHVEKQDKNAKIALKLSTIEEAIRSDSGSRLSQSQQRDTPDKLGLSSYNRLRRLSQRKGKDGVDVSARHNERPPTFDRLALVEALIERERQKDMKLTNTLHSKRTFRMSLAGSENESPSERPESARLRSQSSPNPSALLRELSVGPESQRSTTDLSSQSALNPTPPVNSSKQPVPANQDKSIGKVVYRVTDEHPSSFKTMGDDGSHLPDVLKPEFAHRLEAFSHKIRNKNYIGSPRRITPSPFSEAQALRFSPLARPPVAECGQSTVRSDTRLSSAATRTPREISTPYPPMRLPHPCSFAMTPLNEEQSKVDVRRVLSTTFGNVAEVFVVADRLGINSVSHEELHAFLGELGVSEHAVAQAIRELEMAGGAVVGLSPLEFMKLFAWHPLGTIQEQMEMLIAAQRRRFSIIASFARAVGARNSVGKGQMASFSGERILLTAIRKNLGPIRGLFAACDGQSPGYSTDFVYERELSREQFERGLHQVPGLDLSEAEIAQIFDVLNIKQAQGITFAEIENLMKEDTSKPLRTLVPRPSSGKRVIPLPPTGSLRPSAVTPRKYRPHSAKSERLSTIVGAGPRPTTARARISARTAGGVDRVAIPEFSSASVSQSHHVQSPESIVAWRDGQKLLLQARHDEAVKCLQKALALDPNNTGVMVSCAKALIDGYGDFDGAEDLYGRALAINSGDAATWRLLGNFKRYVRKNYVAAHEHFEQALTIDPGDVDTLRDYADLKASQGDEEGAMELHRRVLQEDPADPLAQSEILRLRSIAAAKQRNQHQDEKVIDKSHSLPAAPDEVSEPTSHGDSSQKSTDASKGDCNVTASISQPPASGDESRQQNLVGAQNRETLRFALSSREVDMAGYGALLHEWGDLQAKNMKLTASSAPLWMDKCLVKLDETLTLAESFHAAGKQDEENMFRSAFANLLQLFYATEKRVERGDVAPESRMHSVQNADMALSSPVKQESQRSSTQLDQGASLELSDFVSSRAHEVEAKLQEDLRNGRSLDESFRLHCSSCSSSTTSKVKLRLHEIDLPDSVRAAIRKHKHEGGAKNWRASYTTPPRSLRPWSAHAR